MTAAAIELGGRGRAPVAVPAEALDDLAARVTGRPLAAGDPGWGDAVRVWNGMVARTPALVLQPVSAADVAAAVHFTRDHGLLLGSRAAAATSASSPGSRSGRTASAPTSTVG
jgi:hypothetical protein